VTGKQRGPTLAELTSNYNKKYGDGTIVPGGAVLGDVNRIPSDIFPVDFVTGGGLPIWRSSCVWGPPAAGKSTLAMKWVIGVNSICWNCFKYLEECQCDAPLRMKSAYVDVEGALDRDWAAALGCDPESYVYCLPDTGEAAVDLAESLVRAQDCGLVIIDSLAMLEPTSELEGGADDLQPGLQARLVAKMFRKVTSRVLHERKIGHKVAALFINQIRSKIGRVFGSPEEQPSGWAAKFAYSLSLRVGARSIAPKEADQKIDKMTGLPLVTKSSVKIDKYKIRVLGTSGEYEIVSADSFENYAKGTVLDIPTLVLWARKIGTIMDGGSSAKYVVKINEEILRFKTLNSIMAHLDENPVHAKILRRITIETAKIKGITAKDQSSA